MKYHVDLAAIHPLEMSPERIIDLQKEFIKAVEEIGDMRRQIEKERQASTEVLADANRLVGLATNLREQLRGEHGIAIDGPISSMTKLLWAIKQFDTEYARQYAAAIQEDPPKP